MKKRGMENNIDKQYQALLQDILDNGVEKKDRTGTGTISVFGRQIRHKMSEGFPLLTTKKMPFKTIVTELLWFLRGDTNIKYLVDNGCNIWNGDAYQAYVKKHKHAIRTEGDRSEIVIQLLENQLIYPQEEFINKIKEDERFCSIFGELGPIYGKQWRKWGGELVTKRIKEEGKFPVSQNVMEGEIDQIQNLINDLKTNPDSRRLMVSAWNVGELDQMVLPPCHYGFQVYTRELKHKERIKLAWFVFFPDKKNESVPDWWNVKGLSMDEKNIPTRAISLMFNMRSVDTFLGLPFNIASYGLLLEIIAKEVNMVPEELIGNLGDVHLYSNHIEQAKEQIGRKYIHEERDELLQQEMGKERYDKAVDELMPFGGGLSEYYDSYKIPYHSREPYPLPTLKLGHFGSILENLSVVDLSDFIIENYQSHPTIKAPLSN